MENEEEVIYGGSASIINMADEQFEKLFFIDILVDSRKIPLVFDLIPTLLQSSMAFIYFYTIIWTLSIMVKGHDTIITSKIKQIIF